MLEEETGEPVPLLATLPELSPHLQWVWQIYTRLDGTRPVGMSVGSIPYSEILALVQLEQLWYHEDIEDILFFIPRLDSTFLKYEAEKAKNNRSKSNG